MLINVKCTSTVCTICCAWYAILKSKLLENKQIGTQQIQIEFKHNEIILFHFIWTKMKIQQKENINHTVHGNLAPVQNQTFHST